MISKEGLMAQAQYTGTCRLLQFLADFELSRLTEDIPDSGSTVSTPIFHRSCYSLRAYQLRVPECSVLKTLAFAFGVRLRSRA